MEHATAVHSKVATLASLALPEDSALKVLECLLGISDDLRRLQSRYRNLNIATPAVDPRCLNCESPPEGCLRADAALAMAQDLNGRIGCILAELPFDAARPPAADGVDDFLGQVALQKAAFLQKSAAAIPDLMERAGRLARAMDALDALAAQAQQCVDHARAQS